ncbi:MAG: phage terminase large subunit family protein [Candidatus Didemnitutus sp.]|nr:phage terminase large subunit family protein [Candidatus Didemnitutus sp.]
MISPALDDLPLFGAVAAASDASSASAAPELTPPPRIDLSPAPPSTRQWFRSDILLPAYRPIIPEKNSWEWADDKNVYLDAKAAAKPGWYASRRTPHVREFNETLTDHRWKEDLVIKSSRTGYTEAALNNIRYAPQNAPGNALFAIDSKLEAKNVSKERLEKTLKKAAGEEFPDDPDEAGIYAVRLRNMTVQLSGSYSAGIFRNKWLRQVVLDECEVKSVILDEGNIFDLAESRINRHPHGKLFAMSKPKKPGTPFHKRWCTGTRSVRLAPCPHCGTFQEFTFFGESASENLKPLAERGKPPVRETEIPPPRLGKLVFSHCKDLTGHWDRERIVAATHYECVRGCRITGRETLDASHAWIFPGTDPGATEVRTRLFSGETLESKAAIMLAGQWLATNPNPHPKRRSRHISDLYCLDDEIVWGELALMFIDCEGDPTKLMHFFNNNLGFVFRPKSAEVSQEKLLALRAAYRRGMVPFVPDLVTLAFDTQDTHYVALICAWLVDGTCAIVDWFHAVSDIDIQSRFHRDYFLSEKLFHGPPPTEPPASVRVQFGLCDAAGHRTDEVYDLCQSLPGLLYPSFGRGGIQVTTPIRESKVTHRMQLLPVYFFADDTFKTKIYDGRFAKAAEIVAAQLEGKDPVLFNLPPRTYLPSDADGQLIAELTAERRDEDGEWDENPGANHFGDAFKLNLVLFEWLLPRLRASKAAEEKAKQDAAARARPPVGPSPA